VAQKAQMQELAEQLDRLHFFAVGQAGASRQLGLT
jgi:hypothetical protein